MVPAPGGGAITRGAELTKGIDHDEHRLRGLLPHLRFTPLVATVAFVVMALAVAAVARFTNLRANLDASHVTWWWIVAAAVVAYGQYVGFAISLAGAAGRALPPWRTLQLEVAEALTTVATPESVGGLVLTMRFLTRQGLETTEAAGACGLNSFLTTAAATVIVPIAGIFAARSLNVAQLRGDLPSSGWELILAILVVAVVVTLGFKLPTLREKVLRWARSALGYVKTILSSPARGATIIGGELLAAASIAACLALILTGLGAPLHLAALIVITQLAGAASNLVPIPGGLGAPEAILVAGLSAIGVHHDQALVAAVLYRLATYWTPTLPATVLLNNLVQRGLV